MFLDQPRVTEEAIEAGDATLAGTLAVPANATGLVMFAHGSGSSRFSPRNNAVAATLREAGLATLLFDLLSTDEGEIDAYTRQYRFDIDLLAGRLERATRWIAKRAGGASTPVGYFGSSTGAAAALIAAARLGERIAAVVSRGGRPDLAGEYLAHVRAPTLLIVGGEDREVIEMNRDALELLNCEKELVVVPGATHLFEEPGTLEEVSRLAAEWLRRCFVSAEPRVAP